MSLWILQISDLHLGQSSMHLPAGVALEAVAKSVTAVIGRSAAKLLVAVCGDVVDKGDSSYYDVAARALEQHLLGPLGASDVVCCPGNHDVVKGESGGFAAFNRFAFRLTNNPDVIFDRSRTVSRVSRLGHQLILANSMFRGHENRERGEIHIEHLHQVLDVATEYPRILMTHHSLIPDNPDDPSCVANAYPVLRAATAAGVVAVLHGHMHAQTILTIGKCQTAVVGVGSLLYRPYPNYNNGFNLLHFDAGKVTESYGFRYVADSVLGPAAGTFERNALPII